MKTKTMKYQAEFNISKSKSEFINILIRKYHTKASTAERRYYDYRKKLSPLKKENSVRPVTTTVVPHNINIVEGDVAQPEMIKMLMLKDMIRLNMKITREFLLKHGFKPNEINWLLINNKIEWFKE